MTDGEGRFSVPALPPATYHIKVELQGFQTADLQNFVLRQGETARPTITLGIATVSEALTVTGEAPSATSRRASSRPRTTLGACSSASGSRGDLV